jgi:hypothetical protein
MLIPTIKVCVKCGQEYKYFKKTPYRFKNARRYPKCQQAHEQIPRVVGNRASGNVGHRPMGHKTRQQHKNTHPATKK